MKRLFSALLALSLAIGCVFVSSGTATAYSGNRAENCAYALYELGLFKGTSVNPDGSPVFSLEKTPTRTQAVIMLVRLLGKEAEAQNSTWDLPFSDVSDTAKPYIGYAYANGLTKGKSATYFGATEPVSSNQYLTFLLRALGYESELDFDVSAPWKLSSKIGLTFNDYSNNVKFTRGTVVVLSISALAAYMKSGENSLIGKLCNDGVINYESLKARLTHEDKETIIDGVTQELYTLRARIGAHRLPTPSNLTSYKTSGGTVQVLWNNPDSSWISLYTSTKPNGTYSGDCETFGSGTSIDTTSGIKYVKIRAIGSKQDSDGTYIDEWSDFTEPISLEENTTPPADRTYTTTFKGSTVYYPGSVTNPLDYVSTAYTAVLGHLKYPTLAYLNTSDMIMIFYRDDNSADLCVSGYIYACNALGVYKEESYIVVFKNGNLANYQVIL